MLSRKQKIKFKIEIEIEIKNENENNRGWGWPPGGVPLTVNTICLQMLQGYGYGLSSTFVTPFWPNTIHLNGKTSFRVVGASVPLIT